MGARNLITPILLSLLLLLTAVIIFSRYGRSTGAEKHTLTSPSAAHFPHLLMRAAWEALNRSQPDPLNSMLPTSTGLRSARAARLVFPWPPAMERFGSTSLSRLKWCA